MQLVKIEDGLHVMPDHISEITLIGCGEVQIIKVTMKNGQNHACVLKPGVDPGTTYAAFVDEVNDALV